VPVGDARAPSMTGWLMLLGSIALNSVGNLLIKRFSATTEIRGLWDYVTLSFVLGMAAFGLGVVLYGRALKDIPIVLAYPIQVGTCVLVIGLFAVAMFGEKFSLQHFLGVLLIIAGIAVLARLA
jgi:multidrug transporter EmrE-like cation transporter